MSIDCNAPPNLRRRTPFGVKLMSLGLDTAEGEVSSTSPPVSSNFSSIGNTPLGSPRDEISESELRSKQNIITSKNLFTRWAFPLFQDQESFKRYKNAQKKDFHWQVILPPFLFIYTISVVSRSSLDRIGQGNMFLTFAHYALYLNILTVVAFVGCHLITYYNHLRGYFKMMNQYTEYYLHDAFYGRCEDIIGIVGMVGAMFFLLSRVTAGACPQDVNLWESQRCNPVAHSKSIPQDQVLLMYSMPLTCLVILRGFSIQGVIICYLIAISSIGYSLYLVGGWLDIYTLYQGLIFALVAFEKERWLRIAYVLNEQIVEKTKMEVERVHREELRELSREAEHEKKLAEIEQSQLRALMGNVAHDLKTPLHSIVADLSALKSRMISLSSSSALALASNPSTPSFRSPSSSASLQAANNGADEIFTVGSSSIRSNDSSGGGGAGGHGGSHTNATVTMSPSEVDQDNPVTLISSIESATQFMAMAINRSQDYMKSSCNMALLPSLSSFEIGDAVQIAYTCVNNLHSGRFVNIEPISADICPFIISDRHWLIENLLCLISNAVKYSDKGTTVNVTVKLLLNDELPTSTTTAAASTMGVTIDDKDVGIKLVKKLKSVQQRDNDPIGYRGILKTSGKSDEKNSTSKGTKLDEGNSSGVRTADSSSQREGFIHSASVIGHDVGLSASNKSGKMMLTFYVEDNGIGISEEKQQVLFQPFKQAQRLAGGTGLGLFSLARRLEALGGRYGVCGRSDGASGSVFWFSFPYRPDASTAADVQKENGTFAQKSNSISTPHTSCLNLEKLAMMGSEIDSASSVVEEQAPPRPSRVLLTDDTHSVLKITGRALQRLGLVVITAENGSESLNVLKQHYHDADMPIDVLLTDLQMPVMDGLESVLRYREFEREQMELAQAQGQGLTNDGLQNPPKKPLIIIGMSANDDAEIREEAIRAGMNGWLTKPFTGDDFARMLKSIIFKIGNDSRDKL